MSAKQELLHEQDTLLPSASLPRLCNYGTKSKNDREIPNSDESGKRKQLHHSVASILV